jgi:dolichol-phosphate mannosyltransferase
VPELSIIVAGLDRSANPAAFLRTLHEAVPALRATAEIVVATDAPPDSIPRGSTPTILVEAPPRFGLALRAGLARASGSFILTIDPDYSASLANVHELWRRRDEADVVIASRYVDGSSDSMSVGRRTISRALNAFFRRGISVGVRDVSSGMRLYRASAIKTLDLRASDYDILQEILVRAYAAGWNVIEVPVSYTPSADVASKARAALGVSYARTFVSMWKLRNSILAADYDYRAHDSVIWLQRYWQRSRYRYITELIAGQGVVLDVGCGSSHIIGALPHGSVAMDVLMNKLRFARRFPTWLIRASGFAIPFPDESFPCVLCSQVIEHVPMDSPILSELVRVLKPGGRLVLGTPDYDNWQWVVTEKLYGLAAPGGYADEHISHYSRKSLLDYFGRRGFTHEATRYILQGELILALRKPV